MICNRLPGNPIVQLIIVHELIMYREGVPTHFASTGALSGGRRAGRNARLLSPGRFGAKLGPRAGPTRGPRKGPNEGPKGQLRGKGPTRAKGKF